MDLELIETGNGGDLVYKGKDLSKINGWQNMIYLALFGGNVGHITPTNRPENTQMFDWWGNSLFLRDNPETQMNSLTENTLNTVSLTSSGLAQIEQAVNKDLEFMKKFADLTISVELESDNRVRIDVSINEPNNQQNKEFVFIWDAAQQELPDRQVQIKESIDQEELTGFVFWVKSDNTGTSNNNQFSMPFTGTYTGNIDWGDGTNDDYVNESSPILHTFAGGAGTYTVKIDSTIAPFFDNVGDKNKQGTVINWGDCVIKDEAFYGCVNFNFTATDIPALGVSQLRSFSGCSSLVGNSSFGSWDWSSVIKVDFTFDGCTLFNQPVTGMTGMRPIPPNGSRSTFRNCINFDQDLSIIDYTGTDNLNSFIDNTGMSSSNYNTLLAKLRSDAEGVGITLGMTLGATGCVATGQGVVDRNWLISNTFMTIIDSTP